MMDYNPRKKSVVLVLYPDQNNKNAYIHSLEIAKQEHADLALLLAVSHLNEATLNKAYLEILSLEGYYQNYINDWVTNHIQIQKEIKEGAIVDVLTEYLENHSVDYIVYSQEGRVAVRNLPS